MTPQEIDHFYRTLIAAERDPGDQAFKARWYADAAVRHGRAAADDSAVRVLARVAFRLAFRESVWNRRQS